jgi:hypothetical protein
MELQTFFFGIAFFYFFLVFKVKIGKIYWKKRLVACTNNQEKQMICSMAMLTQLGSWIDAGYDGSIL